MAALGRQWVGLVHPGAETSRESLVRHLWFVATRLTVGAVALGSVPVILALSGSLGPVASLTIALLAGQAVSALICARTGDLGAAYRGSIIGLGVLAGFLATASDTLGPTALGVLPILIVEGAIIAGRREFLLAAGIGLAVPLVLAAFQIPTDAALGPLGTASILRQLGLAGLALGLGALVLREVRQRQSRERQLDVQSRIIAAGFGDLVTRHDGQGGVLSAGPSTSAVLGVSPEALLGRGLFDMVHVADRPGYLKLLSDVAQGEGHRRAIVRLRYGRTQDEDCAEGRPSAPRFGWFEIRSQFLPLQDDMLGDTDEIVCVLRDISEQKSHEDELEHSRSQAVSANETKSGFLATVSHELRTPLNAIIGFSEMLSSGLLGPADEERRKDYARIINVSGQHLLDVVNTLLDISRIDSGQVNLDPESFAAEGVVAASVEMMALKAQQAGLTLAVSVEPGLPPMLADKRCFKQILLNLLSNGVKFTPSGGSVQIRVARDGDALRMVVEDTGIGIKAEDLPRLGEPFFQAQSGYDRRFEGTGLGLSVVKGLVGLHGGSVSVESQFGKGTRVCVRMPLTPKPHGQSVVTPLPLADAAGGRNDNHATMVKKRA